MLATGLGKERYHRIAVKQKGLLSMQKINNITKKQKNRMIWLKNVICKNCNKMRQVKELNRNSWSKMTTETQQNQSKVEVSSSVSTRKSKVQLNEMITLNLRSKCWIVLISQAKSK